MKKITIKKTGVKSYFKGHWFEFYAKFLPGNQKAGGQQCKAHCPLHLDNDPSLSIKGDSGRFHCPRCGKSGDATKFYGLLKGLARFREILHGVGVDFNIQGSGPLRGKSTAPSRKVRSRSVVMTWAKRRRYGGVA